MRKTLFLLLLIPILALSSCKDEYDLDSDDPQAYKNEMRDFVIGISEYSKTINPDFLIIPQNGVELMSSTGDENGQISIDYSNAIDANGQEDLFYGYDGINIASPTAETEYLKSFLQLSKNAGNTILVTDYCYDQSLMDLSHTNNFALGFIDYAAKSRELDVIPTNEIDLESPQNINDISQVNNFLYLINPQNYNSKSDFIAAVTSTNYDLIIMDMFFDGVEFTASEINQLRAKANGGSRLVVCYLSIGEAEDYRYYWDSSWDKKKPGWLDKENPNWEGNYKVKYWNEEWQQIIYGTEGSYLKKVLDLGFDGVYLDIIDAYEFYE